MDCTQADAFIKVIHSVGETILGVTLGLSVIYWFFFKK